MTGHPVFPVPPPSAPAPPVGALEKYLVKVLQVEDDEDDFVLTRDLLRKARRRQYTLDWVDNYHDGLAALASNRYDVCLLDYRLGAENGLELLRAARERGCHTPVILLTGHGDPEVDGEAMKAGAADYLVKHELKAEVLDRAIRYALERQRAAALAAMEQARLAAFGEEVGLALTRNQGLEGILNRCAAAMVRYLEAALAQIWIYRPDTETLELAGVFAGDLEADFPRDLCPALPLRRLAAGQPELISPLEGDPRMRPPEPVRRAGLVAHAAVPLLLEGRLVGVMTLYARRPLSPSILAKMQSVAHGIALGIERKRTQVALDASEVQYRTVVENIREIIFRTDARGRWTYLNPVWTEITGYTVAEVLGRSFLEFVHPDEQEHNRLILEPLASGRIPFTRFETRYQTKDGRYRWAEAYVQVLTEPSSGRVTGATGIIADVTERKEVQLQIEKLAAFPRFNPNPVLEFSAEGQLTYANDAALEFARHLGCANVLGLLPANAEAIARECLATGQNKVRIEVVVRGHTLSWSFFPIPACRGVHCYGGDITERVNLEAQLRHVQKLESVGQLAAGIAHDFNNILTVIQGNADLVLKNGRLDELAECQVRQIASAAQRAASLTQQLLLFSRKHTLRPEFLNLGEYLPNLGEFLGPLLGEDITIEVSVHPRTPPVEADPDMLEQVILNMAINARDAMPHGGHLRLATAELLVDQNHRLLHRDTRPGRYACITVRDTGCGMRPEILERVFEPFFTTKPVGKGTGLGLAMAYGIIQQHQGWIEVESQPGLGSAFHIYLPATSKPPRPPAPAQTASAHQPDGQTGETILLVEDEPALRQMVKTFLTDCGYRILEASHGHEALRIWEQESENIQLVLTDVIMPEGMSGFDLVAHMRARMPALRVLFSSGYNAQQALGQQLPPHSLFLPKPYSLAQLAQVVRQALNQPTASASVPDAPAQRA